MLSQFIIFDLNLLTEIIEIRNKSHGNTIHALMMFIVEAFIKMRSRSREMQRTFLRLLDRLPTIIIPCDVETRVIAGRKDRISYRRRYEREEKKTWNAKWRERCVHTERVRPRTTKIIFSLTRLRCEAENSLRRKEIAWVQKIQNIRYFQASSSDYINLLSNIWQIKQLSLWQSRRKILRKSFCQFKILLKVFGICEKKKLINWK